MIEDALPYLCIIITLGGGLWWFEQHTAFKLFTWLPAIVVIYLVAILLSQSGLLAHTPSQTTAYKTFKSWLLPMLLFLMLLKLDIGAFASMGKQLIIAYFGAVISLALAFIAIFILFGFGHTAAGIFGALAGSWTGGTANMLAVAGALDIPESQLGPALVVDSLLYTLWVSALLLTVPLAGRFDRWSRANNPMRRAHTKTAPAQPTFGSILFLLGAAVVTAFALQRLAEHLPLLPGSTWLILLATIAGSAASLTPLSRIGGSDKIGSFLLYLLIALIGSHASLEGFADMPRYLAAATLILLLHLLFMLLLAKRFRLSLFVLGIASLSNIGGVASAPILAAAYHKQLVGAAVIMAITGYLVGTVVGLGVAWVLAMVAA